MRQGDCARCRLWIPQPNSTQGATAHARYYGPVRSFKPLHRAHPVTPTGSGDRGDAVDERSCDHARSVALVRQRRQLPDEPTFFYDQRSLVSTQLHPDSPAVAGRRWCPLDERRSCGGHQSGQSDLRLRSVFCVAVWQGGARAVFSEFIPAQCQAPHVLPGRDRTSGEGRRGHGASTANAEGQ